MSTVVFERFGNVYNIAADEGAAHLYVFHEVAPLLHQQVLAPLQSVEEKVARPRRKLVLVGVAGVVELEGNVGVDPEGEVVVEETVLGWNVVDGARMLLAVAVAVEADLPAVELAHLGLRHVVQNLFDRLVLVAAAPVEGAGEVVAGAHGDDGHGRLAVRPVDLLQLGQDPANCAVTAAN